ncbi:MAG: hypothetical protein ACK5X9_16380 [Alphaproteobacteria bacterium]
MSGSAVASTTDRYEDAFERKAKIRLLKQIEELQKDGLLLLDHLTKQPGRSFTLAGSSPPADAGATENTEEEKAANASATGTEPAPAAPNTLRKSSLDALSLETLRLPPNEIIVKEHGLRDLVFLVDGLARLAAPVTPKTIRNSKSRILMTQDVFILLLLCACFVLSIAMLWRADEARSLVTQLRQTQSAANEVFGRLRLLDPKINFEPECGGATRSCPATAPKQADDPVPSTAPATPPGGSNTPGQSQADPRLNYLPFCTPGTDAQGRENKTPFLAPRTREAEGLCSALAQHQLREQILFGRLQAWNCSLSEDSPQGFILSLLAKPISAGPRFDFAGCRESPPAKPKEAPEARSCPGTAEPGAAPCPTAPAVATANEAGDRAASSPANCGTADDKPAALACGNETVAAVKEVSASSLLITSWRRSEFRTIGILSLITKHLLPALLALVGACTYLLRLRYRQRSQSLLEDLGWGRGPARLLMPAALGGLLSVVWNTGDVINPATVTIQDLSLSLAFIAFLLGYAFDPVLEWLEGKIRETFLKLNGETKEISVK